MVSEHTSSIIFRVDRTALPSRYDPIQKLGPSDCVASINAIVDKFDSLVDAKNEKAIQEFKAIFGLEALSDIRDFAATIAFPRVYLNPRWIWDND
jgi:hypothetical protein